MKNEGLIKMIPQFIKLRGRHGIGFLIMSMIISIIPQFVFGQSVSSEIEQVLKTASMPTEKGLIVCSREVKLKSSVDPIDFEKWIISYWNPEWQDLIPGFQSYIAKGDNVPGENNYSYFLIFKPNGIIKTSLAKSDQNTEWYREFIYYEPTKHLYEELFAYIEINPFFDNRNWIEIK